MQLLIYTLNISPRKKYIFDFIFESILGISYQFTSNVDEFLAYNLPKISYTNKALADELHFEETAFLSEVGISKQDLSFVAFEDYEVPFPVKSKPFPFDVFAASFYLVSRYEEYGDVEKDNHDRFAAKFSIAFKKGFLDKPVIDEWAFKILEILQEKFPQIRHKKREFIFQPTLDIDRAYYLKSELPLRRFIKKGKLILKGNIKAALKDPFDVYDNVLAWDKEFSTKTMFFMLMGTKHKYDVKENKSNKLFKNLVKRLKKDFSVGLHPSYFSNESLQELNVEKVALESISADGVYISRQHFLKLHFPNTYKNLIKINIKEDYTLVYADLPGFRASTCTPFLWYNLSEEKVSNLFVQPTVVMDQTLRQYMKLKPEAAIKEIEKLMKAVRNVGGTFVSLWHNESVNDFGVWKGWKKVYVEMLKISKL